MRLHRYIGTEILLVAAAHSVAVAPGAVVDFDKVIRPAQGQPYSLETALGAAAELFEVVPEDELVTGDGGTAEPAAAPTPLLDPGADLGGATITPTDEDLAQLVAGNTGSALSAIAAVDQLAVLERLAVIEATGKDRVSVLRAIADRQKDLAQA